MENRKKRFLAVVLSFVLAFGMVTPGFAADGRGEWDGAGLPIATPSDLPQMEVQTASPAALVVMPFSSRIVDISAVSDGDYYGNPVQWSFAGNRLTVYTDANIEITGIGGPSRHIVVTGDSVVTLQDATMLLDFGSNPAILLEPGVNLSLNIQGINDFRGAGRPAIQFLSGATVTIDGTGTLTATGGTGSAAIGSAAVGTINIDGGIVTAIGLFGEGIGTGDGGTINITGGMVNAIGASNSAGIGGGSDGGTINISGGVVTATSGGDGGGAGIGGGRGGSGGTILISGDATVQATGGDGRPSLNHGGGAGIGGGGATTVLSGGSGGSVTITGNANVTATGGNGSNEGYGGPGIGGGGATIGQPGGAPANYTHTGGTVNATGGTGADGQAPGIQRANQAPTITTQPTNQIVTAGQKSIDHNPICGVQQMILQATFCIIRLNAKSEYPTSTRFSMQTR